LRLRIRPHGLYTDSTIASTSIAEPGAGRADVQDQYALAGLPAQPPRPCGWRRNVHGVGGHG